MATPLARGSVTGRPFYFDVVPAVRIARALRMPSSRTAFDSFLSDSARASCIDPTSIVNSKSAVRRADSGSCGARRLQISSRTALAPAVYAFLVDPVHRPISSSRAADGQPT